MNKAKPTPSFVARKT